MLSHADRILKRFAGRFLGKSSPVHFFWGAFDLALTRFSGRRAPEHDASEWWVLREANSHEEISLGFWPGSGAVPEPAFYAYARPEPPGLGDGAISPAGAYYQRQLANFILPYEAVRGAVVAGRGGAGVLPERVRPGGHAGAVGSRGAGPATGRMALIG